MTTDNAVMVAQYDWRLVALSVSISILAAYAARALAERVTNAARRRAWFAWLIGGAMVDGIGTWSMHYTGMLAFSLPVLVQYDLPTVGLSLLIAVIGSGAALLVWSRPQLGWRGVLLASILLGGLGISGLHFSAMAAMRYQGMEYYSPILTMISVGLAIVFSLMSLAVAYVVRESALGRRQRYHISVLLRGVASPVLHYTAMAAATFIYFAVVPDLSHAVSIVPLGFLGISIVPVMVLVVALLTTLLDRFQKQEEKYRTVFETALDVLVLLDQQGNIFDINHRAEALTGYSQAELRGKNVFQYLIVDEDQPMIRQMLLDIAQGLHRDYEVRWRAKDGHIVYLAGASAARFSPSGEFLSSVCALRDITERKQTEEALRQYTTRLATQYEIDEAILAARSLDEISRGVLNRVISLVPCQGASVTLFDFEAQNSIVYAAQVSGSSALPPATRIPFAALREIGQHILTLRRGEVLVIDDLTTLLSAEMLPMVEGQRAALVAPLRTQDELIGTLNLSADRPDSFTPEAVDIIREVAASLAIAIAQLRLLEEVSAGREQMKLLASRILSAQEEERRYIAYELHDEIGQNLTALKMSLDMSSRISSAEAQTRLEDAAQQVDELLNKVRSLTLDLRPAMLDHLGLLPTLQSYFERYTSQTQIQVIFKHTGIVERFPMEIETAAYRIVQEALTNVARYAHVAEAIVRLWVDQDKLNVQIEDRGVGFQTEPILNATKTSGLRGMRERAALLGGQLVVESAPGAGTKLTAELPLPQVAK